MQHFHKECNKCYSKHLDMYIHRMCMYLSTLNITVTEPNLLLHYHSKKGWPCLAGPWSLGGFLPYCSLSSFILIIECYLCLLLDGFNKKSMVMAVCRCILY